MQQGNKITGFRIPFTANARASLYHVTKFCLISSFAFIIIIIIIIIIYYLFYVFAFLLFIIATAHYWPSSGDKKSCRHAGLKADSQE